MFRLKRRRSANGRRLGANLRPARIVDLGPLANGLHRNLEKLDGRSPLGSPRIHGVQCLVTAPHRLLALEESDTEALARLTIHEHEHLRPLEPGRSLPRFDLGTNHFDCVVDTGRIAKEVGKRA